jgi:hypothetical protein
LAKEIPLSIVYIWSISIKGEDLRETFRSKNWVCISIPKILFLFCWILTRYFLRLHSSNWTPSSTFPFLVDSHSMWPVFQGMRKSWFCMLVSNANFTSKPNFNRTCLINFTGVHHISLNGKILTKVRIRNR